MGGTRASVAVADGSSPQGGMLTTEASAVSGVGQRSRSPPGAPRSVYLAPLPGTRDGPGHKWAEARASSARFRSRTSVEARQIIVHHHAPKEEAMPGVGG